MIHVTCEGSDFLILFSTGYLGYLERKNLSEKEKKEWWKKRGKKQRKVKKNEEKFGKLNEYRGKIIKK